jgi:hypothetical protein
MSANNKPTGFRDVIHFFSCWGLGDACLAVLGALGSIVWPSQDKGGDWLNVAVGIIALIIYFNIAYLSRPRDDKSDGQ